jgi:hypothetical protein
MMGIAPVIGAATFDAGECGRALPMARGGLDLVGTAQQTRRGA